MLRLTYVLPLFALLMATFASCGNKENNTTSTDADTTEVALATEQGPGKDDERHRNDTARLNGHLYNIDVKLAPDDSLQQVKDAFGDPYLDNRVRLVIERDGNVLCTQSLTKKDFLTAAGDAKVSHLILGGLVFTNVDNKGFHFGAQLNGPGDEEGGLAFKVVLPLSGQGTPSIALDPNQDTSSKDEEENFD